MKELMTVKEAADFLGVKPGWVYDQTRAKKIPCHRIGPKYIRLSRTEVMKFYGMKVDNEEAIDNDEGQHPMEMPKLSKGKKLWY